MLFGPSLAYLKRGLMVVFETKPERLSETLWGENMVEERSYASRMKEPEGESTGIRWTEE